MKGKTHMILGVAGASVAMSDLSFESSIALIATAAIGSLIPDSDHPRSKINKRLIPIKNNFFRKLIYMIIGIGLIYTDSKADIGYLTFLGLVIILTGLSSHRGFTHSILGFFMFSIITYSAFSKYELNHMYIGFMIGYGLHLLADFFTNRGIKVFYPLKRNFKAPITIKTGGVAEYIIVLIAIGFIVMKMIDYF